MATKIPAMTIPDMPNGDTEASMWLRSFAGTLARDPEAVGVSREQSDAISALVAAFEEKLITASNTWSRTTLDVQAKNLARNEAVQAVRPVVKAIKANPAVSNEQRINLGLPARMKPSRRRESTPVESAHLRYRRTIAKLARAAADAADAAEKACAGDSLARVGGPVGRVPVPGAAVPFPEVWVSQPAGSVGEPEAAVAQPLPAGG